MLKVDCLDYHYNNISEQDIHVLIRDTCILHDTDISILIEFDGEAEIWSKSVDIYPDTVTVAVMISISLIPLSQVNAQWHFKVFNTEIKCRIAYPYYLLRLLIHALRMYCILFLSKQANKHDMVKCIINITVAGQYYRKCTFHYFPTRFLISAHFTTFHILIWTVLLGWGF